MSSLWTPDRDIPIGQERGVTEISQADMKKFADMHELAQRLGIVVLCRRCDRPFMGANDNKGRTHSIQCQCREIRAEVGGRIVY